MTRIATVVLTLVSTGALVSAASPQAPAPAIEATWRVIELPGQTPSAIAALPQPPNLRFEAGRVTGFTGCNNVNGAYTIEGGRITFGPMATTMRACIGPAGVVEQALLATLTGTLSYAIDGDRLTLTASSGAVVAFEREVPRTPESNPWSVTGFNNGRDAVVSLIADTRVALVFEDGTVSGNAGCNTFRAPYSLQEGRITIGPAASTRMMCGEAVMMQEREFLAALQSAVRWAVVNGMLDMHRADDQRVLTASPDSPR